jgi:hypothetical protein
MADTYTASIREIAVGALKRHMAVWNGVGSGKVLVVFRITAAPAAIATATGLNVPLAAIRLTSAPTGGTPRSFGKACPADITGGRTATPDVPAEVIMLEAHTGGNIEGGANPITFGLGSVNSDETSQSGETTLYESPPDGSDWIYCPEGWGFEIRQGALAGAGNISILATIGLLDPSETLE